MPMARPLVVWQWCDGKRGHERQCDGLIAALSRRVALEHHRLAVPRPAARRLTELLAGALPDQDELPNPALILGAGRSCELPVLASRRARGGLAVYLMRPRLPYACFDLCLVPAHDAPRPARAVIVTDGPLNPMHSSAARARDLGLVLLGGPSAHHGWDAQDILAQMARVVAARPDLVWHATDSRRSPAAMGADLRARPDVEFHPWQDTAPDWLPGMLARAAEVWVSADSVSMIFEALSAGAIVGVLPAPVQRPSRITRVAADLRARERIMLPADLAGAWRPPPGHVQEAARIADLLLQRWPHLTAPT